jgi:uncharacterized protein YdaU (DUF1376 family)
MAERQPWFKLFAADFLVDPDVDSMPRESEGLLLRMWCLCHIEGSCPADPEELARKTRCSLQYVLQCKRHCESLFELRGGRLYSHRMEEEKRRSEQARENASKRYEQSKQSTSANGIADGSANGSANGSAIRTAQSQSQSQSQSQGHGKASDAIASESSRVAPINRGTRLSKDFSVTEEHRQFAGQIGADADREFAKFQDYFVSVPGQKGTKADWDATFRNWLRRSVEMALSSHGGGNGKPSIGEIVEREQAIVRSRSIAH